MPYQSVQRYFGLGKEAVRGTAQAPTLWLPIAPNPSLTPQLSWLKNDALVGSPVEQIDDIPSVRHDEFDFKGNVFADTFGGLLMSILGVDTPTVAPANTTLSSSAIVGASTILTVATIAVGSSIAVGTGATLEYHTTSAVSGAGPFTVTLVQPLVNAQNSGATVAGLTGHTIGLANAATTGSQPPSYTGVDTDNITETGGAAKQLTAGQLDSLTVTFSADGALSYQAKFLANPYTQVAAPASSFTTEVFIPAWSGTIGVAGANTPVLVSGQIAIKRNTTAVHTVGTQSPYRLWAGPVSVSGKVQFIAEANDATFANSLTRAQQALVCTFVDPVTAHAVKFQMSKAQLKNPKVMGDKSWQEISADFTAQSNTVDAVAGGYSPIQTLVANSQVASY